MGPVKIVGYSAHKKGFAHAPETPLAPGDLAHYTFYWQAPDPLPADWPAELTVTLRQGGQSLTAPLAGGRYPTAAWPPGRSCAAEFDLPYDPAGGAPLVQVRENIWELAALPAAR